MIDPERDLDDISPVNIARVLAGEEAGFAPYMAEAVMGMLRTHEMPVYGKHAVVMGCSLIVGRTLAVPPPRDDATIVICYTQTRDLKEECKKAEIPAVVTGRARLTDRNYVPTDCMVLDIGINAGENGNSCSDINPEGLSDLTVALTPVPCGIGAATTSMLAECLVQAAARRLL